MGDHVGIPAAVCFAFLLFPRQRLDFFLSRWFCHMWFVNLDYRFFFCFDRACKAPKAQKHKIENVPRQRSPVDKPLTAQTSFPFWLMHNTLRHSTAKFERFELRHHHDSHYGRLFREPCGYRRQMAHDSRYAQGKDRSSTCSPTTLRKR